jgi:nicotinamidase-related amidase
VTEQCVLYTAIDAYMREFSVVVPPDAVAHIDAEQARAALEMVASNLGGECGMAASVSF